ncbi:hypothetical protein NFI96_024693, partial [Prochilodus magdalenae]
LSEDLLEELKMRCSLTCRPADLHTVSPSSDTCGSACGPSDVAIDNKIEQAMDLVKGHLMLAVRGEVEVLKERIKELWERNSVLRRENTLLKSLANLQQLQALSTNLSAPHNPQLDQRAQLAEWVHTAQWAQQVHQAQIAEWTQWVQQTQWTQRVEWTQWATPTSQNSNSVALIHPSVTSM